MGLYLDIARQSLSIGPDHHETSQRFAALQDAINCSRDWQGLEQAVDDAQEGFVCGELTGPDVDRLVVMAKLRSKSLPENWVP